MNKEEVGNFERTFIIDIRQLQDSILVYKSHHPLNIK